MHRPTAALALLLAAAAASAQGVDQLWSANCLSCHGDRAQGGGAGTRTLLTDELMSQDLDRRFFDSIKAGLPDGGMPGFGQTMTDPQIWAMVNYIRELQARDRRQRVQNKPDAGVYTTQRHRYRIQPVITAGLDTPWSVEFLPDGSLLTAERPGHLRLFKDGKLGDPIAGTPAVRNRGQGGLMDTALHPDFKNSGWIYLAFSDEIQRSGRSLGMTKIVRGRIKDNAWTDQETIFQADPAHYLPTDIHFGSRIAFDPKDPRILFFPIGERGRMEMAPDLSRPNGKIHRVTDDGKVPDDNPFVGREGALPTIWSYGHRNPQGLIFDLDGTLWDTEHGPRGGDECNLILKGRNYGWPTVSFGINYNGAPFTVPWPAVGQDIAMPAYRWMPSIGACGLTLARGQAFPDWQGDLLAGGLSGQNIDRLRLKDGKLTEREELFHNHGRVRDVACAPDGTIYVVLNGPDHIVRLTPAETP